MLNATTTSSDAFYRADTKDDPLVALWAALRRHLEAKNGEINAEVARYPTPIARCDVQLSKLLEQRAQIYRELARIEAIGDPLSASIASGEWKRGIERFISETEPDREDEVEVSLRAQLIRAVWLLNQSING